jgi:signal transduction histidine kinase
MVDGRCEASLSLFHARPGQFELTEHVLMQTVAEQLAAALRSIKLRTESESRARRLELLEHRHRDLLERLVRAQEQERSRVAGDLHDDTVQVLAACVISLDRVRRSIETGHVERAADGLRAVSGVISEAVDRTRRMTFELRPAVLWHHGLVVATQQLLNGLKAETGAEVELRCDELPRLDPTLETIAFRSLSELISNVRNHAGARHVSVEIAVKDAQLTAVVADDGRGFDLTGSLERARATNHLGLEALSERIDAAGGGVTIRTTPGAGTTVSLRLPIRA